MSHRSSVEELETFPRVFVARCNCRWMGKQTTNKQEAEDEQRKHDEGVQRILATLRGRTHTKALLKSERDYYREMSLSESCSQSERDLWAQLADELDRRVGGSATEQEPLFE